jgi:hypothetical protein
MTEEHYFEHGSLKTVGNVTNNQTFFNTYLSDDLLSGQGTVRLKPLMDKELPEFF